MIEKIVIALGGNALQKKGEASADAQQRVADVTTKKLASLVKDGNKIAILHGNGPQVGNIVLHEEAINTAETPTLPLDSSGAMSQGLIGYWLQQSFQEALNELNISTTAVTLVTQIVVDTNDPAFLNPSKPIGPFYDQNTAEKIASERGFVVKEDSGRGWRRVVPSPKPIKIVEIQTIKQLFDSGVVVISSGGGGIPVIEQQGKLTGVEAVIDKDFSAALLAGSIDADKLVILTSVDAAMINFGKPDQRPIGKVTVSDMERYLNEGHFASGSMLPKVQAALSFVKSGSGKQAIIASLDNVQAAVDGSSGTIIY